MLKKYKIKQLAVIAALSGRQDYPKKQDIG
jgi:hypothetical protein